MFEANEIVFNTCSTKSGIEHVLLILYGFVVLYQQIMYVRTMLVLYEFEDRQNLLKLSGIILFFRHYWIILR